MVDKVKIFASDDNLKILGELLSNDSSRKIMLQLMTEPMYVNELAAKLDMRVSLVVHHLNKMKELGLIEYTLKKITKKGQKHTFLKINSDLFITINKTQEEIKETGFLKRVFRDGIKFFVVGFVSLFIWVNNLPQKVSDNQTWNFVDALNYPFYNETVFLPLLVIIVALIVHKYFFRKKRKDRSLKI